MAKSCVNADVAIVGGGLAGLATAAYLSRSGLDVRLTERAATIGGRAATGQVAGFSMNRGPHALYRLGEALAVLRELGVQVGGHVVPGRGHALRAGTLHRLPVDLISLLSTGLFPFARKVGIASLLGSLPRVDARRLAGVSVSAWLDSMMVSPEARELALAFCRLSTYANAPDLLSAETAVAQLQKALGGVLYVDDGWQTLADGLATAAEVAGARIECGARALSLSRTTSGNYSIELDDARTLRAKIVVLAIPPSEVTRLVASAGVPGRIPSAR